MNKKIWMGLAGLILILSVVFLWKQGSNDGQSENEDRITRNIASGNLYGQSGFSFLKGEEEVNRQGAPTPEAIELSQKLYAMYPPNSRPLRESMKDLTDPFSLQTSPLPVNLNKADNPEDQKDIQYQFLGPKYFIAGDETFVVYLKVFRNNPQQVISPQILKAEVLSDYQSNKEKLNPPEYNDSGRDYDQKAGDGITTFSWKPGAKNRKYWGQLTLKVQFKAEGHTVDGTLDFFSTPNIPATFTGNFQEEIVDGSLLILAEINVKNSGQYVIEANLYHKNTGKPLHWVYFNGPLSAGVKNVPLTFFGKIFHDAGLDGRYVLKDLRGYRNNLPFAIEDMAKIAEGKLTVEDKNEPHKEFVVSYAESFVTQEYKLSQFSDKAYQEQQP